MGGFDAGGKPVRHRKGTLRPSNIIPSAWDNFSPAQKKETEEKLDASKLFRSRAT